LSELDALVDKWTDEQLAGQLLVVGFDGEGVPPELAQQLAAGERAGVVLFRRNLSADEAGLEAFQALCRTVGEACPSDLPPLIAIDEEGGRVARLHPPALVLPPMRAIASAQDPALVEKVARVMARQLRCLGLNMNFAPVVDVDTNPDNPIIGDRALSDDAATVATYASAYLRGLRSGRVMSCLKHFPGHGDTLLDSHLALPFVQHERARLDAVELAPFRALCREADSIMTAHVVYGALDAGTPATLSKPIVTGILRGDMGFEGVVFSDDLEMKAIADQVGLEGAAVDAIWAGCDLLLVCQSASDQQRVQRALVERLQSDAEFRQKARVAALRGLRARRRCPAAAGTWADFKALCRAEIEPLQVELRRRLPGPVDVS
jgi:beta-N-acetylhexosaminidase